MGFMASDFKRNSLRLLARTRRQLSGQTSHILYFYQADDPYSHLVIQRMAELQERYSCAGFPIWFPRLKKISRAM